MGEIFNKNNLHIQTVEAKYKMIFKTYSLIWLIQFMEKPDKSKFSLLALLFKHFFIKIQPNMSEQEKKRQKIYDLLNAETKPKKKKSGIIGVTQWPPSSPDLNTLDYAI